MMSARAAGSKLGDPKLSLGPSFFAYYQQAYRVQANAGVCARFCKANPIIRYRMSKTFLFHVPQDRPICRAACNKKVLDIRYRIAGLALLKRARTAAFACPHQACWWCAKKLGPSESLEPSNLDLPPSCSPKKSIYHLF